MAPWQKANPCEGRGLKINVKRWQQAALIKTSPTHPPLTYNHNKHDMDSIQSTQPHAVSQQTAASGNATEEQTGRQGKQAGYIAAGRRQDQEWDHQEAADGQNDRETAACISQT